MRPFRQSSGCESAPAEGPLTAGVANADKYRDAIGTFRQASDGDGTARARTENLRPAQ